MSTRSASSVDYTQTAAIATPAVSSPAFLDCSYLNSCRREISDILGLFVFHLLVLVSFSWSARMCSKLKYKNRKTNQPITSSIIIIIIIIVACVCEKIANMRFCSPELHDETLSSISSLYRPHLYNASFLFFSPIVFAQGVKRASTTLYPPDIAPRIYIYILIPLQNFKRADMQPVNVQSSDDRL